jgi:hypothetical protein
MLSLVKLPVRTTVSTPELSVDSHSWQTVFRVKELHRYWLMKKVDINDFDYVVLDH